MSEGAREGGGIGREEDEGGALGSYGRGVRKMTGGRREGARGGGAAVPCTSWVTTEPSQVYR